MSPHIKSDTERKDHRISVKITRASGAFLEALAAKMHAKGKIKKARNINAAVQQALDYAQSGQKAYGWDEVIDG